MKNHGRSEKRMRRRGVAVPTSCRLWINHWEGDPSIQFDFLYDPPHSKTQRKGAGRIKLTIPGSWAACCFLFFFPPPLPSSAFSPATAAPSRRFLASSAPLSADAYSSTQPVCIYTDMFVCCWFPNSQSAPLVSALLFFTLSLFFLPVGAPLLPACVVPASLHKTSQEAHLAHRVTVTSQNHSIAVDPPEESSRGGRRIGGRRRGGVKNWYKRIVLSAEWIQHLSLLLCSHVHDASFLYDCEILGISPPNKVRNFVYFFDRNHVESLCLFFGGVECESCFDLPWFLCCSGVLNFD